MSLPSSPLSPAYTQEYIPHLHSPIPSPIAHRYANPNPNPRLDQELDESSQSSSAPTRRSDTPIGRSNGSAIGTNTRTGLKDLHQRVYGSQPLCLVTQAASSCEVAHCVAKASKAWDVSHAPSLLPSQCHVSHFSSSHYTNTALDLAIAASTSIACVIFFIVRLYLLLVIHTDRSS